MGCLDRMVDQSFREREDGTTVFFPWGALGSAYVIESRRRYRRARTTVRTYLRWTVPAVVGVTGAAVGSALWLFDARPDAFLGALAVAAAVVALAGLVFAAMIRPVVEGLPETDERPDVRSRLWMPGAFPELRSANRWAAVTLVLVLGALFFLYEDVDPRILGLAAGAVVVAVWWVRLRRPI